MLAGGLSDRPGLLNALRPPLGRLQYFRVVDDEQFGTLGCLNDVLGALLGRQGEGAQEKFEGHPTLEIIDTSEDHKPCDVLCRGTSVYFIRKGGYGVVHAFVAVSRLPYVPSTFLTPAIRVGALPRLHSLRADDKNFDVQSMVQNLLLANPSPPPLKQLRSRSMGEQPLTLSLASGLLRSLPLEEFQARVLWPSIPLSELGKEEEESIDDQDRTGAFCAAFSVSFWS